MKQPQKQQTCRVYDRSSYHRTMVCVIKSFRTLAYENAQQPQQTQTKEQSKQP